MVSCNHPQNPYAQRTWLVSHRDQAWLVSLGIRTRHSPSLGHSLARLHPSPGQGCRIFKTLTLTKPWHLIGGFLGIAKKKFGDAWGTYFHLKTLFRRTKSKYFGWVFFNNQLEVQQRGVEATKFILMQLLDGMNIQEKQPVLIVDMLPSRRMLLKSSSTYVSKN